MDQEVVGSIPTASTTFSTLLSRDCRGIYGVPVSRSLNSEGQRLNRSPLCLLPDMGVPLNHGRAYVTGQGLHRAFRNAGFSHLGDCSMPQVVEPTIDARICVDRGPRAL